MERLTFRAPVLATQYEGRRTAIVTVLICRCHMEKGVVRVLAELILTAISVSAPPTAAEEWVSPPLQAVSVSFIAPIALSGSDMMSAENYRTYPAQGGSNSAVTLAINRLIGGIISYVRWPDARPAAERRICVVGTPHLTDNPRPSLPGHGAMSVSYRDVTNMTDCDAIYIGSLSAAERLHLMGWVRNKAVLTITDADPSCSYGAMFCLMQRRHVINFSVNLDAIGRGPLRVDPRVLRIGRDG